MNSTNDSECHEWVLFVKFVRSNHFPIRGYPLGMINYKYNDLEKEVQCFINGIRHLRFLCYSLFRLDIRKT